MEYYQGPEATEHRNEAVVMVWVIGLIMMICSLLATTILKLLFEPDRENDRKVGIAPLVTDEANGKDGQPGVEEE